MGLRPSNLSPRVLLLSLLIPLVSILVVLLLFSVFVHRARQASGLLLHTHQVISQALRVEKLALDMETGVRGFQISRDPTFLEPYDSAGPLIRCQIEELKVLVEDNPAQVERVVHIETAFEHWARFADEVIQLTKVGKNVTSMVINNRGKALMDDLRLELGWFREQEDVLQEIRRQEWLALRQVLSRFRTVLLAIASIGIGLFVWAYSKRRVASTGDGSVLPQSSTA